MARRVLFAIVPVMVMVVLSFWLEPILGRFFTRILIYAALALGGGLFFKYAEDHGLDPGPFEPSIREMLQSDSDSKSPDKPVP
jgi:hypothetical protein